MSTEAPEGIVAYSWSGNLQSDNNYRTGIQVGNGAYIDTTDILGTRHTGTEYLQLSDTIIETLDLISEGVIEGPLSGKWIFSGNLGQTGWSSAYFSGYNYPSGYQNLSWLRSVYWNELPVLSDAGQFNFQNVNVSYTQGTPNGDVIQQLTNEESTSRSIGTRLYAGDENAQVFRILNQNCKGAIINIRMNSLNNENSGNGNIERTLVQYQVSYRPVFNTVYKITAFSTPVTANVFGKIASAGGYINSTRLDFNLSSFIYGGPNGGQSVIENQGILQDPDFIGWEIRVSRITPDSTTALLANETYIDNISELYGSQFSYPNSAIFRASFDAQFFSEIPSRGFECNLLRVKIPANYNPILRTYATGGVGTTNGAWNGLMTGDFWTNNPAWCFYDLISNRRYGLGKYIDNISLNKFDLYNIAQYCDELVADSYGGLEPRFTCNVWLASKEDAYKVVNDMASIFRGMCYYFNGNINVTQDQPKTPRYIFNNANVENGDFKYSTSSKRTRQSIAVIRYNDPKNFYKPAIEYVEDLDSIRKYGIKEIPITAFGCTSRGQAIRLGKWAIYSNNIETETVEFIAGIESSLLRCGDVFGVIDYNRKLKRYGGRTLQINNSGYVGAGFTGAQIVLDSKVELSSGTQYTLSLLSPTYYYDPSQVTGLTSAQYQNIYSSFIQNLNFSGDYCYQSGNYTIVNIPTGFDSSNYNISGLTNIWSIELGPNSLNYTGNFYFFNPSVDYYRVLNIKESDSNKFNVVGLSYNGSKFQQIDTGTVLSQSQLSSYTAIPSSPYALSLNAYKLSNSASYIQYSFLVNSYSNISSYYVYATTGNFIGNSAPDSKYLISILPNNITSATFPSTITGNYLMRVYGFDAVNSTFSTGCASGSVYLTNSLPIQDVIIGGLGLN